MKQQHILVFCLALLCAGAAWPQINLNPAPSRTVGHPVTPQVEQNALYSANPNLVEGRELYQPQGIALDLSSTPPAIYVSDTANNRVLGWKDATKFANGQSADIVIGQVDFFTTYAQGPGVTPHAPNQGLSLQSGLSAPTGLATRNGDLYVVDSGNNRVLRFPKPFAKLDHIPDLVIGQQNLSSRGANWTGQVSAQGVFLASGSTILQAYIAFDTGGNLWLSDAGNRRVLEFAAADITAATPAMSAILEIGQPDMATVQPNLNPNAANSSLTTNQFAVPSGIAFDPQGRLYVSDAEPNSSVNFSRVLVFQPPFQNAMSASRIMGIFIPPAAGYTAPLLYSYIMNSPTAMFFDPNGQWMGVVDTGYNRILLFDSYDKWPAASSSTQVSPKAIGVVGHNGDFASLSPNNAPQSAAFVPPPTASVFANPTAVVFTGTELYLADTSNNRAIVMPFQSGTVPTFGAATRALGQARMDTASPNYVEGREFNFYTALSGGTTVDAGVAIDATGDTPHLYVSDTGNHRILAFRDMRKIGPGVAADLIIGQQNGQTALCNYPSGNPGQPAPTTLCNPAGLLVDKNGDLWVADRGNGRVLRFATPFSQTGQPLANLVLGQSSFYTKVTDATSSTMASPYGLAMTYDAGGKVNGSLLVSDQSLNRVLVFDQVNGAFSNGQAASKVIGQPDFRASATGSDFTSFSAPHHIAVDTDNRLYVADTGNSRVSIFDSLNRLPQADASAALNITGLSAPQALYVSAITGDIWVGQVGNGRATRYPRYDQLFVGATSNYTLQLPSSVLALTQDQFGALFTADGANRVAFYFPQLAAQNAANFLSTSQQALAPGMIATLYPFQGTQFNGVVTTDNGGKLPLPNVLADTQVLFNGVATPLFYVSSSQINFYVPMRDSAGNPTPTTGFLDVQVVRKSTGQVLGAGLIPMAPTAPALFMNPPGQTGPSRLAAIINDDDGTVNSQTNPAKRGSYISLWGTGQGFIANAPPDGTASTGIVNADPKFDLKVFLGSDYLDCNGCAQGNGEIQYSGLAPGYVGLWQINIKIPPLVGTGTTSAQALIVRLNNVYSAGLNLMGFNTVVYVK